MPEALAPFFSLGDVFRRPGEIEIEDVREDRRKREEEVCAHTKACVRSSALPR